MKRCTKCKQEYPATPDYFHRDPYTFDGLRQRCKNCICKTDRHTLPDGYKRCIKCKQILPATRDYFTYSKTEKYGFCGTCRDCRKKEPRPRGVYPPPGTQKQCVTCRESYPATLQYFQSDASRPDHLNTRCKSCFNARKRTDHARAVNRVIARNRQSRKKAIPGKLTAQDIQEQYKRQKGKCYYCRRKLEQTYGVDHLIPVSREGSSNDKWNIVIACMHCNSSKSNKMPHEWPEGGRLL